MGVIFFVGAQFIAPVIAARAGAMNRAPTVG